MSFKYDRPFLMAPRAILNIKGSSKARGLSIALRKWILIELIDRQDQNNWPVSYSQLGLSVGGVSERAVRRAVAELIKFKLVTQTRRTVLGCYYQVDIGAVEKLIEKSIPALAADRSPRPVALAAGDSGLQGQPIRSSGPEAQALEADISDNHNKDDRRLSDKDRSGLSVPSTRQSSSSSQAPLVIREENVVDGTLPRSDSEGQDKSHDEGGDIDSTRKGPTKDRTDDRRVGTETVPDEEVVVVDSAKEGYAPTKPAASGSERRPAVRLPTLDDIEKLKGKVPTLADLIREQEGR